MIFESKSDVLTKEASRIIISIFVRNRKLSLVRLFRENFYLSSISLLPCHTPCLYIFSRVSNRYLCMRRGACLPSIGRIVLAYDGLPVRHVYQAIYVGFAPVATAFDTASREVGACDKQIVDKHESSTDTLCHHFRLVRILNENRGAQSVVWLVCQIKSILTRIHFPYVENGSEKFFLVDRTIGVKTLEQECIHKVAIA